MNFVLTISGTGVIFLEDPFDGLDDFLCNNLINLFIEISSRGPAVVNIKIYNFKNIGITKYFRFSAWEQTEPNIQISYTKY